jgi:hypothetical protein
MKKGTFNDKYNYSSTTTLNLQHCSGHQGAATENYLVSVEIKKSNFSYMIHKLLQIS